MAVETFDMENNKLSALPESFGYFMPTVQKLNLQNNKLTALPESLGNLTALKFLYLHNYQLTTLPGPGLTFIVCSAAYRTSARDPGHQECYSGPRHVFYRESPQ